MGYHNAVLREFALATSLALLTGLFSLGVLVLGLLAPGIFKFLFNAQFLGADVASLFPKRISFGNVIGTLMTLVVTAWVFGYAWARLYNWLAKYF